MRAITIVLMAHPETPEQRTKRLQAHKARIRDACKSALRSPMADAVQLTKSKTQGALAEELGLSQRIVSDVINGKTLPEVDTIVLLAQKLGRSIDSLLGLTPAATEQMERAQLAILENKYRRQSPNQEEWEIARAVTAPSPPLLSAPEKPVETSSKKPRGRRKKRGPPRKTA